MQNNDLPKKSVSDGDDLKFEKYASRVAKGILNYSQTEAFVISLEGEWGSGKTTLVNFIKNDIKKEVEILHFNPWLITDVEQVVKLFFDELMKILISKLFDAKLKKDIVKDFQRFASLILPESLKVDVGIVKIGYKPKDVLLPKKEKNLENKKENINKYLKNFGKKIVIIIDDIDRLTDKETEFIFRLVKGIADFDNLIYILLYDKNVVSKSLEKFKAENGGKYLEKIIQYPLSVPKAHKSTIKNLLFKELDAILDKLTSEKIKYIFNEENWNQVHFIVGNYIKTVRDINQIINIISFEYPIIAEDVNFTDFFIISLIKLKNHTLYEFIQNNPNDFEYKNSYDGEKETKRIQENFNDNLKQFHHFKDLLEIIFPVLNKYSYRNSIEHKNKYIADIYYFENYFSFSTADDKISMREYYEIKNLLINNIEKFKEIILKDDKQQKSEYFLEMFNDFDENLKKQEIENIFFNTLKISKKLKSKDKSTSFSTSTAYEYLGFEVLIKHTDIDTFLLNIYEKNTQFELIRRISLLEYINKNSKEVDSNKKINISDKILIKLNDIVKIALESITLENIKNYSEHLNLILRFDMFNASLAKLSKEINDSIFKSSDDFFRIIDVFQTYSIVNRNYKYHKISKETLAKFVDLDKIEEYIKKLDKLKLSNEENTLLQYWNNKDYD